MGFVSGKGTLYVCLLIFLFCIFVVLFCFLLEAELFLYGKVAFGVDTFKYGSWIKEQGTNYILISCYCCLLYRGE